MEKAHKQQNTDNHSEYEKLIFRKEILTKDLETANDRLLKRRRFANKLSSLIEYIDSKLTEGLQQNALMCKEVKMHMPYQHSSNNRCAMLAISQPANIEGAGNWYLCHEHKMRNLYGCTIFQY